MRLWGLAGLLCACAGTGDDSVGTDDTDRSTEAFPRCADHDALRRQYFGDLHVHTALSLDANTQGTRLRPTDAYRFARGEPVGIQPYTSADVALRTVQLERPLDFTAVTDHAEFLGTVALCTTPGSPAYDEAACVQLRQDPQAAFIGLNAATAAEQGRATYPALCGDGGADCLAAGMDVWGETRDAADAAYDRTDACQFTSFVGYEWSGGPGTKNLHRNVIFRTEVVPETATSYFDESYPEGLWDRLDAGCLDQAQCDVITIPHNANLSSGLMFRDVNDTTYPAPDAASARRRARMEPLVEIFQHKGDGECWPGSSAADELCGFEKVPYNTLAGANLDLRADPTPLDFVRDVLGEGLRWQSKFGADPYRYGIIASTDTHLATPGLASESGFPGHGGAGPGARDVLPAGLTDNPFFNPGGLAVLWAEENSREGLFRAMRRKEAYGTSGPRLVLRAFAGWGYDAAMCDASDFARQGYDGGVPMGADLPAAPDGATAPTFAISALADVGTEAHPGAPLQRLQVVKGWLDGDTPRFKVFDVGGDPTAGADLDPATCAVDGAGEASLCSVWTDPEFDPSALAFWYVRAVEVPTCRWTQLQCNAAGVTCPAEDPAFAACCDADVPKTTQERAWSSPFWFFPADG
jgi:hypothetical protein